MTDGTGYGICPLCGGFRHLYDMGSAIIIYMMMYIISINPYCTPVVILPDTQ
jgi:hypothetical protein